MGGAALAAALGFAALTAAAAPARADVRVQFGVVGIAPPVVVAPSPPPPPAYGYVYGYPYPYAYSYPPPYYAAPAYGYGGPFYVQGRYDWHHRHGRDRDDWDDRD